MRNIIVHDDDMDLDTVWETVEQDLPKLIVSVEACLAGHPPPV